MTANVVYDMPMAAYQAVKALSASGAWRLSEECPARFWQSSPWNPEPKPEARRDFDIGTALHLAVLETSALADRISVVDAEDFRTKAAREQRDEAHAAGLVPLLRRDLGLIAEMQGAIERNPDAAALLADGRSEVSLFWEDEVTGTPCKARVDRLREDGVLVDLKTTACAAPRLWQAKSFREGHFLRAPWYLDGAEVVLGSASRYAFVVVETEAPHVVQVYDLDERALAWGRQLMRRALTRFAACVAGNRWQEGYAAGPLKIELPAWAEYQLADREQSGDFRNREFSPEAIRRGLNFLSP